jgi:Clp amino terminal domain, pathogenicity island component
MTLDTLIGEVKTRKPHGTALDELEEAALMADHLGELADHLLGHFVDQARRAGASWQMIGQRMGVTKQAAQKRFVAGEGSMARFTNRANVVMLKAQNEARERGNQEVTSLHLVLGLLAEWEGFAGRAIEAAGVTKAAVATAAIRALAPSAPPLPAHAPLSVGVKKVHELSEREALRLGHDYVGTEHLLLGLLEAQDEPGARVLTDLGISKAAVEAWTLRTLEDAKRSPGRVAKG